MPNIIQDNIKGALKLTSAIDRQCFTSFTDFVEKLPSLLSVEVPASVSNVVIGPSEPGQDDIDKLWLRRDNNGSFLGWYAFQNGNWNPFYNLVPGEVVWLVGDSTNPPDGFTVIDTGDPTIPAYIVTVLKGLYIPSVISSGYAYYAARFSGF